jgi:hypothetical protein
MYGDIPFRSGGNSFISSSILPAIPAAAFAGPGGKDRDRLYIVGADGQVTVLSLK